VYNLTGKKTSTYFFVSMGERNGIMEAPPTSAPTKGVETALDILGGKWKVLILWHLIGTTQRYGALRRLMPQITEKMLIRQLRELEEDGIISRTVYQSVPPRVEYAMTDYGQSLYPILGALCQWGWAHLEHTQDQPATEGTETQRLIELGVPYFPEI
jgi:DNA-binding HxlR family transcriptional regulator